MEQPHQMVFDFGRWRCRRFSPSQAEVLLFRHLNSFESTQIATGSKILDHASIVQTLKTYGHYYPSDMQDSLFGLGAAFEELS